MNKTIITGHVGQEPRVADVNGKSVCNFSVAVKDGKDKTTWYDVALWSKDAVYPYIKKGSLVLLEGRVEAHSYTGKDGVAKASLRLQAFQIELLGGSKSEATEQPANEDDASGLPF